MKRKSVKELFTNPEEPSPARNMPFRMEIVQLVPIKRRGTAVLGTVDSGTLKNGEPVMIAGKARTSVTTSSWFFESLSRVPDSYVAFPGDSVAMILRDVQADQIEPGMVVTKPPVDG